MSELFGVKFSVTNCRILSLDFMVAVGGRLFLLNIFPFWPFNWWHGTYLDDGMATTILAIGPFTFATAAPAKAPPQKTELLGRRE